jgi:hypothetical protein
MTSLGLPIISPEDMDDEIAASVARKVLRLDRERLDAIDRWIDAGAPVVEGIGALNPAQLRALRGWICRGAPLDAAFPGLRGVAEEAPLAIAV